MGLKNAQTRYRIYNLELLAIVFACMKLKDYMNGGLPFTILIDCKALDKLERMDLAIMESSRTMRSTKTIWSNNIEVRHIKGDCNKAADFLISKVH